MLLTLIIIVAVIAALVMLVVSSYNRLIVLRNRFKNAFAQIEVQLKRRYDLIPNLVETAKGYLKHERETLTEVTDLRNKAVKELEKVGSNPDNPEAVANFAAIENQLQSAVGRLNIAVEAYPELKGDSTMIALTEELTTTENKISFARQGFNDAVTSYNNARETFPTSLFAASFGFQPAQLLEFDDHEQIQEAPKVSF